MLTIRAMAGGQGYAQRHLQHNDYYDQNQTVHGTWQGRGAELLGLKGQVTSEAFESIREGLDPATGEFLRPRHSADRTASNGETESKARAFYDLTFSAPKSVSVQALVGGDERLIIAHQVAVRVALEETERHSSSRVRLAGANHDRTTGNMVVATYTHDSSRQLDPQLHTHAVAANLTYDGTEGRWKALQASGIYKRRAYLTEVYRNALAREVRALGYEVENQRNVKGIDMGFEIKGVSRDLLERYSQRSEQRDQSIRSFTAEYGRPPTDNEVAVLVRESRPDKLREISTREVRDLQMQRITSQEHSLLTELRGQANECTPSHDLNTTGATEASLQHASEHLFERRTVVKDYELLTDALRHARGEIDLNELRGRIELEIAQRKMLQSGGNIATQASLERERAMVAAIDQGIGRYQQIQSAADFEVSSSLRAEQLVAVKTILGSKDFAVNLRGAAGTGKTATLREIHRGLTFAGYDVLAVAPTRSAVEELQRVGFRNPMTISRLLEDEAAQRQLRGNVLIVDEAGMVSGRQMEGLLSMGQKEGARIVFSGDTRQIQSVESMDALRILERESRMTSVSLTEIQRQSNPEYRAAIQMFRQSPQEGFERLAAMGAIREVPCFDRSIAVANAYREMTEVGDRKVLVVAPTYEEIERVTGAIRADLKQRSVLGHGEMLHQLVSLQWTEAQKKDLSNYQAGQQLVFNRNSSGIEKHEALTVRGTADSGIRATNERGEEKRINLGQARSFSVNERRKIEVAAGDKLLLTGNSREPGFRATNGEIVTVRNITEGILHLDDGRIIPSDYHAFTHGYAVTAHRSQGKTVDQVIISADSMKRELFYVAASRGREGISIITSDAERLGQSLGVSMARPTAIELANTFGPSAQSPVTGIEMNLEKTVGALKPALDIVADQGLGLGL